MHAEDPSHKAPPGFRQDLHPGLSPPAGLLLPHGGLDMAEDDLDLADAAGSGSAPQNWSRRLDRAAATVFSVVAEALEVVVPVECAVCRAPAATLCLPCRRLLSRTTAQPRRVEHHARHAQGLPIVAAGRYEHELATCLLAFKQAGRTDLTSPLSSALARALRAAIGSDSSGGTFQPVELVPVPSSAAALRRRWFDPVKVLLDAVEVEATVNPDVHCVPWLAHTSCDPGGSLQSLVGRVRTAGAGQAQKFKTADQRAVTGKPPFRVVQGRGDRSGGRRRPTDVILVDDVVTTGATLNRARRILEEAGATVRGAVVLAAANTPTLEMTGAVSQKSV